MGLLNDEELNLRKLGLHVVISGPKFRRREKEKRDRDRKYTRKTMRVRGKNKREEST